MKLASKTATTTPNPNPEQDPETLFSAPATAPRSAPNAPISIITNCLKSMPFLACLPKVYVWESLQILFSLNLPCL